jgi:fatty acid desaturase
MIRDVALCWGVIFATWAAVATWTSWWLVLLAIPIIGTRFYALFIIGHDGLHRRALPGRRANDLFCDLLIFGPIGAITRINNRNHLEHHRTLGTLADPDRHRHACFNKADRPAYVAFLTGLANLLPAVRAVFMKGSLGGHKHEAPRQEPKPRYQLRDIAILVGCQLVLVAGLTLAIGWWAYPALWMLPLYVHVYLGDLIRSFFEHSHPEADRLADEHRLITYTSNPVERALLAPMNMNFHAVHHLWPSIPYYNLPAADREARAAPQAQGLIWRGSYLAYGLRYWRALPLEECRRDGAGPSLADETA